MKKINVEATKFNNEDVIATSSATHSGKYHLMVAYANYSAKNNQEICYLFDDEYETNQLSEIPSDLAGANLILFSYENFLIELGADADFGDWFYWNGSSWVECTEEHGD